jgi:thiol-disulfide isomerase/thioredoxin
MAAIVALSALALSACAGGGGDPGAANPDSAATDYEAALAGAPKQLARLYADGDALLPGGLEAYEAKLAELRGRPVVVNVWASWCGPCRFEFPHFQRAAARFGDEVAFIGVDTQDSDAAAETFLDEFPVPYPSISDPDREVWNELELRGLPATAFYDSEGELAHLRQGPYSSEQDLAADIERYARDG